jgi:hypothetical protein
MKQRAPRAGLSNNSADALRAELNRRQYGLKKLHKKHAKLAAQMVALQRQIDDYGGSAGRGGGRGRRPRNDRSLVDVLTMVLKGKTMGVAEAADAVQATGYTSNARNFKLIVNQALIKSEKFKKVSRGQYTAK